MTIAIALKVTDGVVLGTDSAASLLGDGDRYYNIFHNAEKTFHLARGLPVGVMTYGLGSLAGLSIGSLVRSLRSRLEGASPAHGDWVLQPASYTLSQVAASVTRFFYDELYQPTHAGSRTSRLPALGFMIAGFSAQADHPEVWTVEIRDGECAGPVLVLGPADAGRLAWRGESEALDRLLYGANAAARVRMMVRGLTEESAAALLEDEENLATPAMPMQDAIDLVRYLADVTTGFARFRMGPPTVAGPIDIAAITRHQGFRWIARKHYYSRELNPHATSRGTPAGG